MEEEAEFSRCKGVWREQDYSWMPLPRLRMCMEEIGSYLSPEKQNKTIPVTGLGLGAKGEGETGFFS